MRHPFAVGTLLLALVVGLSPVPLATAGRTAGGTYSVFPRVVATVMALEPRGLAAIRTREGATYEVLTGTTWRVGDTVAYSTDSCHLVHRKVATQSTRTLPPNPQDCCHPVHVNAATWTMKVATHARRSLPPSEQRDAGSLLLV